MGIERFWRWWTAEGAARVERAIETGDYGSLTDELNDLVSGIDAALQWELGKGRTARHALCVTAAGDPDLRPLTERWRRAAPPEDATWEYVAARAPDPGWLTSRLSYGGYEIDLALTRLSLCVDESAVRTHVTVHHPVFAELGVDEQRSVAYLVLDWLLGEDDVERWVGAIDTSGEDPADGLPPDALPETVRALAKRYPQPGWVLMESVKPDGARWIASALRPIHWLDHPRLDQHLAITLRFSGQHPDGLPLGDDLARLRADEDQLTAELGDRALLVAHETFSGQRILHLYCDPRDRVAAATAAAWVGRTRGASIRVAADPGWAATRAFR
ncbi:DUF695 domain-containing protein [Amycolatopsis sp. CA-230715]|uniref:DUF695 domain-containing protein n=1 Tax=Amycolatopsis sp. CA-230715 TaxID=2745196 RepID=UPI001C03812A|nr:DUF695 domain-containing protein [Amycolatopsis sp. CA-230715]QWF76725.1 hypothetical protein HUW46_00101 [Amycolatopsis sp. CA-230715]